MDSEKIDELIQKYWRCETSLEEEQELHAFFSGSKVPDHLKESALLFKYFSAQRNKNLTDVTFDKQLMKKIRPPQRRTTTLLYNSMRIAAGILVLIAAIWLVRMEVRESTPTQVADTYDDPKMAFEETKKALMMISRSFSAAEQQAKKIGMFNEAQQNVQKAPSASETINDQTKDTH